MSNPKDDFVISEHGPAEQIVEPVPAEVWRFLKTTNIKSEFNQLHRTFVDFSIDKTGFTEVSLFSYKSKLNLKAARTTLRRRVSQFCTKSARLSLESAELLQGTENNEIIKVLREMKCRAGWGIYATEYEVRGCSTTYENVDKMFVCLNHILNQKNSICNSFNDKNYLTIVNKAFEKEIPQPMQVLRYFNAKRSLMRSLEKGLNTIIEIFLEKLVLKISGSELAVNLTVKKIGKLIQSLDLSSTTLTPGGEEFLHYVPVNSMIQELRKSNLVAGWCVKDNQLKVCTGKVSDTIRATQILCGHNSLNKSNKKVQDISISVSATAEQLRYLKTLLGSLRMQGVEVITDISTCSLSVKGEEASAANAVEVINKKIGEFTTLSFPKSDIYLNFLCGLKNQQITKILIQAQVKAGWDMQNGKLWICSDNRCSCMKAKAAINNLIEQYSYPESQCILTDTQVNKLSSSEYWKFLVQSLRKESPLVQVALEHIPPQINLVSFKSERKLLLKVLNSLLTTVTTLWPLKSSAMETLYQNNWTALTNLCKVDDCNFTLKIRDQVLHVECSSVEQLDEVKDKLWNVESRLTSATFVTYEPSLIHCLKSTSAGRSLIKEIAGDPGSCMYSIEEVEHNLLTQLRLPNKCKLNLKDGYYSAEEFEELSMCIVLWLGHSVLSALYACARRCLDVSCQRDLWSDNSSSVQEEVTKDLEKELNLYIPAFINEKQPMVVMLEFGSAFIDYEIDAEVVDVILHAILDYMYKYSHRIQGHYICVTTLPLSPEIHKIYEERLRLVKERYKPKIKAVKMVVSFVGWINHDVKQYNRLLGDKLQGLLSTKCWSKSMCGVLIDALSLAQRESLEMTAKKNHVKFTLSQSSITIRGLKPDVQLVREAIDRSLFPDLNTPSKLLPMYWNSVDSCNGQILVEVDRFKDAKEYCNIISHFKTLEKDWRLIGSLQIYRVQNEELNMLYNAYKKKIKRELREMRLYTIEVEKQLWHGTTIRSAELIARHGFDRSLAGSVNGHSEGQGTYFTQYSETAFEYARRHYSDNALIMAKVVTGNYKTGWPLTSAANLSKEFHSTVNDILNPYTFVVYHDAAAYPEYVIKFKIDVKHR